MHQYLNERRSPRVAVDEPCGFAAAGRGGAARLRDLSVEGALVKLPLNLPAGGRCELLLHTGRAVPCVVVRRVGDLQHGVRFVDPYRAAADLRAAGIGCAVAPEQATGRDYASHVERVSGVDERDLEGAWSKERPDA